MHYLVQPREQIYVKDFGFLFFAKNMWKIISKNLSTNVSGKYCQKLFD